MNISEIFDFVLYLANKYQAGRINATEFNLACKVVNTELFNVKAGLPEEYQAGAPYPRQAYQITQKITDDLRTFITPLPIAKVQGFFPLPANYAAFSSLRYKYILNSDCGEAPTSEIRPIEVVSDGELSVRLDDNVIMPTLRYPVATYQTAGILVYPKEISNVILTYLRYPIPPVYNYTISNDEYIYNPVGSTQLEYPDTLHGEFCARIVRYLSINIREEELLQSIQERIKTGQ